MTDLEHKKHNQGWVNDVIIQEVIQSKQRSFLKIYFFYCIMKKWYIFLIGMKIIPQFLGILQKGWPCEIGKNRVELDHESQ